MWISLTKKIFINFRKFLHEHMINSTFGTIGNKKAVLSSEYFIVLAYRVICTYTQIFVENN